MLRWKFFLLVAGVTLLLSIVYVSIVSAETANSYRTRKLNNTSVIVSCNDEREPKITRFENTTFLIVTCTPTK